MTVAARGPVGGMAAGGLVVTGGNDLVRLDSGKAICHQMPPGNRSPTTEQATLPGLSHHGDRSSRVLKVGSQGPCGCLLSSAGVGQD